ncbi:MAG: methyltransferase domain-containing protein [Proteobacteria bacterium]|nr:MAG: methyltransferase domain-containing protein [Pseudomonadota bacterium]
MQSPEEKSLWQKRWQKGQTGWDQGGAHPALLQLIQHAKREAALPEAARFFSAGCGAAHSEAVLAEWGHEVRAIDLSEEAIAAAKQMYGKVAGLELVKSDLFEIEDRELAAYDAIYDRAMLCALPAELRPDYIEAMKKRLKKGGLFCGILFRLVDVEKGPPFAVDEAEAYRVLHRDFVLCYAAAIPAAPVPAVVREEWICVWRLRGVEP